MGLDIVEVFLRAEETFAIAISDDEAGQAQTVGDLYRLVLEKLSLAYLPAYDLESLSSPHRPGRDLGLSRPAIATQWTAADVWVTIKALVVDQLKVDPAEVTESARFQEDLGAD